VCEYVSACVCTLGLLGDQVVKGLDCRPRVLFRVQSPLTPKLRRRITFVVFGGNVRLLVPGDQALAFSMPLLATIVVNPSGVIETKQTILYPNQ